MARGDGLKPVPQGESVQLTERINRIQISPTAAVIAEADRLKSQGVDYSNYGPRTGLSDSRPHQEGGH